MPLETGTKIEDLNPLWPLGSDPVSEGDDHTRLIKSVLQNDALVEADVEQVSVILDNLTVSGGRTFGRITLGSLSAQCGYGVTSGGGGLSVTFSEAFREVPQLTATAETNVALTVTFQSLSPSGVFLQCWDNNGTQVDGVGLSWTAFGRTGGTETAKDVNQINRP